MTCKRLTFKKEEYAYLLAHSFKYSKQCFFYYLFKAGIYAVCATIHNFIIWFFVIRGALHCLLILIGDFVLDVAGTLWDLIGGCLNTLPALSLFPFGIHLYISSLTNGCLCFLCKLFRFFGRQVFLVYRWRVLCDGMETFVNAISLELLNFMRSGSCWSVWFYMFFVWISLYS